jgi:hypothetical protein
LEGKGKGRKKGEKGRKGERDEMVSERTAVHIKLLQKAKRKREK